MAIKLPTFLILWFSIILNTHGSTELKSTDFKLQGPVKTWAYFPDSPENSDVKNIMTSPLILKFDKPGTLRAYAKDDKLYTIRKTYYPSLRLMQKLHFDQEGDLAIQEYFYYNQRNKVRTMILTEHYQGAWVYLYHYKNGALDYVKEIKDYDVIMNKITNTTARIEQWEKENPRHIYYYNAQQQLIKVETWSGDKVSSTDPLTYDSRGRLLSIQGGLDLKMEYNHDFYPIAMTQSEIERSIENMLDEHKNPIKISDIEVINGQAQKSVYNFSIDYWE